MYIRLECRSDRKFQALRQKLLKTGVAEVISVNGKTLIANIRDDHRGTWLDGIKKEFNVVSATEAVRPKDTEIVPCGLVFINTKAGRAHTGRCKSCLALRTPEAKSAEVTTDIASEVSEVLPTTHTALTRQNYQAKTLVSVQGLTDFSLTGMLEVLQTYKDTLFSLLEDLETIEKSIQSLPEVEKKYQETVKQRDEVLAGLRYFVREEYPSLREGSN